MIQQKQVPSEDEHDVLLVDALRNKDMEIPQCGTERQTIRERGGAIYLRIKKKNNYILKTVRKI